MLNGDEANHVVIGTPGEIVGADMPSIPQGLRGGPKTDGGKDASRRNALKHGLTASTLLPEVLQPGRVAALRGQLEAQLKPANPVEKLLVGEIARHGAMLELGEEAEGAVLRRGAFELSTLVIHEHGSELDEDDAILAAAVASEAIDRFSKYRRGHEKALFAALNTLRELQARRDENPTSQHEIPQFSFTHEQCEDWLRSRFERGDWRCPSCGHAKGHWLETRGAIQCAKCRKQHGLRSGTVMAGSSLPLPTWFSAIRIIQVERGITAAELGRKLGIRRAATAQRVLNQIRAALASNNAADQLFGLTEVFDIPNF